MARQHSIAPQLEMKLPILKVVLQRLEDINFIDLVKLKIKKETFDDIDNNIHGCKVDPLDDPLSLVDVKEKVLDGSSFNELKREISDDTIINQAFTLVPFETNNIDVKEKIEDKVFCDELMITDEEELVVVHNQNIKSLQDNNIDILEEEKKLIDTSSKWFSGENKYFRELRDYKRSNLYVAKTGRSAVMSCKRQAFPFSQSTSDTHKGENPITSSQLNIETGRNKNEMITHTWEKQYYCHQHPYKADIDNNFSAHINEINQGVEQCKDSQNHDKAAETDYSKNMQTYREETPLISEQCSNKFVREVSQTHMEDNPFNCSQCSYKTGNKKNIRTHMLSHVQEQKTPFKCSQCPYKAGKKKYLVLHMQTHTGDKPYNCSHCSYKSGLKSNLIRHIQTHWIDKPFNCSLCSYKVSGERNLKEHMQTHTGDRPYNCSHCSYKSGKRSNLIRHIHTHCVDKSFNCSLCSYKPFNCIHCSYTTAIMQNLTSHMIRHAQGQEKTFKCTQCPYKAGTKRYLYAHMQRHREDKPYNCSHCSYKSGIKSDLKRHIRLSNHSTIDSVHIKLVQRNT